MAEIKLWDRWQLAHDGIPWEQTGLAIFIQPLVAVLARTAEIMLLAGAFQTAANVTNMTSLKVLAGVMYFVLGSHLYMTFWRYIVMPLGRTVRLHATLKNLVLILILGGALMWLYWFLVHQVTEASKHLVLAC